MKRILFILIVAIPLFLSAKGPVKARVAGLESNSEYMSLLGQEQQLKQQEDSLTRVVAAIREEFREKPEIRAQYSSKILSLEGEIFEVRNEIGMVASRITAIEQEFVINNIDKHIDPYQTSVADVEKPQIKPLIQSVNFVDNIYLRDNLSASEYSALRTAQSREKSVVNYIKIYRSNHSTIKRLANSYLAATDRMAADSIFGKYKVLTGINAKITDSVSSIWDYVYDNKSYTYNYLMDKMNQTEALVQSQQKLSILREKEAALRDKYASDIIAAYPLRKKILLDYELKLSDIIGLDKAADSLQVAFREVDTTDFNFEKVDIKERFFIDYEDIKVVLPTHYGTRNPIPKCTVYDRGTIYRILIGTYTKLQSPTIFKGISPLGYLRGEDGKYRYYAGGYETAAQALAGLAIVKRAGIRAPEIVNWEHGVERELDPQSTVNQDNATVVYTIEITSAVDDLSDGVKSLIATVAPNKEISRADKIFIVGSFNTLSDAEKLAAMIREQDNNLSVKISTIVF